VSVPLVYSLLAREDIDEAFASYQRRRVGLGWLFLARLKEQLDRIKDNPQSYAVLSGDVRAAAMRQFPYVIYYRAESARTVVVAVLHGRRHPRTWQSRT